MNIARRGTRSKGRIKRSVIVEGTSTAKIVVGVIFRSGIRET